MKLTFESNLQYQIDAIKSITDLFEGQPIKMRFQKAARTIFKPLCTSRRNSKRT